jgi:hypothetical protein
LIIADTVDFLHDFLSKEIPTDAESQSIALRQKEGFLNIGDLRCFTAYGKLNININIL